jgi:hypothetical protein
MNDYGRAGIILGSGGVSGILGYIRDKKNKKENYKDLKTETLNFLKAFGNGITDEAFTTSLAMALTYGVDYISQWYHNYKARKEYIKNQNIDVLQRIMKYPVCGDDVVDFDKKFKSVAPYFKQEDWEDFNELSDEEKINYIENKHQYLQQDKYVVKEYLKLEGLLLGGSGIAGIIKYLKHKKDNNEGWKNLKTEIFNFIKAFGKGVGITTITQGLLGFLRTLIDKQKEKALKKQIEEMKTILEKNKPEYIKNQKIDILNRLNKIAPYGYNVVEFEQSFNRIAPHFTELQWIQYNQQPDEGKVNYVITEDHFFQQEQELQQQRQQRRQQQKELQKDPWEKHFEEQQKIRRNLMGYVENNIEGWLDGGIHITDDGIYIKTKSKLKPKKGKSKSKKRR